MDFIFLEEFHSKTERKLQTVLIDPLPPNTHSLPHYQHPAPGGSICYDGWTYTDMLWSP